MRCPGSPAPALLLAGLGAVLTVAPTAAQEPPPSEMREEYPSSGATARYSNFRRFGVSVDEKARLPETGEP